MCTQEINCNFAYRNKDCKGWNTGMGTFHYHLCNLYCEDELLFHSYLMSQIFLNKIIKTLKFNHRLMEKLGNANAPTRNNQKA